MVFTLSRGLVAVSVGTTAKFSQARQMKSS